MGFKEDLTRAIEARTSPPTSDTDDLRAELARLSRRMLVLERLVVQLASYKVDGGGGDSISIGKHLLYVVKDAMSDADAAADESS
jgi:hypothetical protein